MDSILLIIGCALIGIAVAIVLLCAIALANQRPAPEPDAHELGRLLAVSHPEWN